VTILKIKIEYSNVRVTITLAFVSRKRSTVKPV